MILTRSRILGCLIRTSDGWRLGMNARYMDAMRNHPRKFCTQDEKPYGWRPPMEDKHSIETKEDVIPFGCLIDRTTSFLNDLVSFLSYYYYIPCYRTRILSIEEVLRAKDGEEGKDWFFRRYSWDELEMLYGSDDDVPVGERDNRVAHKALSDVYEESEWAFIKEMAEISAGTSKTPLNLQMVLELERLRFDDM
jgi:hypothetical protein